MKPSEPAAPPARSSERIQEVAVRPGWLRPWTMACAWYLRDRHGHTRERSNLRPPTASSMLARKTPANAAIRSTNRRREYRPSLSQQAHRHRALRRCLHHPEPRREMTSGAATHNRERGASAVLGSRVSELLSHAALQRAIGKTVSAEHTDSVTLGPPVTRSLGWQ